LLLGFSPNRRHQPSGRDRKIIRPDIIKYPFGHHEACSSPPLTAERPCANAARNDCLIANTGPQGPVVVLDNDNLTIHPDAKT